MRVLTLGINYWPEQTGIAVFTTGRCEYLAARGHQVTVCTAMPYYPDWRVADGYHDRLVITEQREGVTIKRARIYVPNPVTSARRILHEASFITASFLRAMWGSRPDIILAVSPPLGLALSALILSRLWRVPYIFHVADLQPDAAIDLGMLPSGRLANFLYGLEKVAYRKAARVSTLTEAMRNRIVAKGIRKDKVTLFSDWAEPALFELPLSGGGSSFRQNYDLSDRFLVVHAGNMGVKQGLDVVLGAALLAQSSCPGMLFLLVGDGAMRAELQETARFKKLNNVRFQPLMPTALFQEMLAASDVCLVTQRKSVADIVFPSKVLTLLAAGRPVVASLSRSSEVARIIDEACAGVITEAENSKALLDGLLDLQAHPEKGAAMSERGRTYAREHWDKERALKHLEATMLATLKQPPRQGNDAAPARANPVSDNATFGIGQSKEEAAYGRGRAQ
jgi:colanic acid biosynthesis glycosyl transferase WcaI